MEMPGEAFFLLNAWMNFLSLALAGGMMRRTVPLKRGIPASLLLSGAAAALINGRAYPVPLIWILPGAFLLSGLTFGRRAWHLGGLVLAAGLLLSGIADFLLEQGLGGLGVPVFSGAIVLGIVYALRLLAPEGRGKFRLRICKQGKEIFIPALRDSGNRFWDGVSVLPVIVAPAHLLAALLPLGTTPRDLSTLPRGFRILRMETAAGSRAVMCFQPDGVFLNRGKKEWRIEAMIAVADFSGPWALLPEALFQQKEEKTDAGL